MALAAKVLEAAGLIEAGVDDVHTFERLDSPPVVIPSTDRY